MFRRYGRLSARPTGGDLDPAWTEHRQKLLLAMHGELACESTPGNGATFTLETATSRELSFIFFMDFLVIDDDKTFRDRDLPAHRRRRPLRGRASSGTSGLTELKEGRFDSVLLDLNLGSENGLDILEQIPQAPAPPAGDHIYRTRQRKKCGGGDAAGAVDFGKAVHPRTIHLVLASGGSASQLKQNIDTVGTEVKTATLEPGDSVDQACPG